MNFHVQVTYYLPLFLSLLIIRLPNKEAASF